MDPSTQIHPETRKIQWDDWFWLVWLGMLGGAIVALWLLAINEWFSIFTLYPQQAIVFCLLIVPCTFSMYLLRYFQKKKPTLQVETPPGWVGIGLSLFIFSAWAIGYYAIGTLTAGGQIGYITGGLDAKVSYVPEAVFIYLSVQLFTVFAIALTHYKTPSIRVIKAYLTVLSFCFAGFLIFPIGASVPELVDQSLASWALSILHTYDINHNSYPSSHCAMALLSALFLFRHSRNLGWIGLFHALAIGASTVLIKQHYIIDVWVGFLIALITYILWFPAPLIKKRTSQSLPS